MSQHDREVAADSLLGFPTANNGHKPSAGPRRLPKNVRRPGRLWEVACGGKVLFSLTTSQIRRKVQCGLLAPDTLVKPRCAPGPLRPLHRFSELLEVSTIEGAVRRLDEELAARPTAEVTRQLLERIRTWFHVLQLRHDVSQYKVALLLAIFHRNCNPKLVEKCYQLALADCPPADLPMVHTHLARFYACGDLSNLGQSVAHFCKAAETATHRRPLPWANLQTVLDCLEAAGIAQVEIDRQPVPVAELRRKHLGARKVVLERAVRIEHGRPALDQIPTADPKRIAEYLSRAYAQPAQRRRRVVASQLADVARRAEQGGNYRWAATWMIDAAALDADYRPAAERLTRIRDEQSDLEHRVGRQKCLRRLKAEFYRVLNEAMDLEAAHILEEMEEYCADNCQQKTELDHCRHALHRKLAEQELALARRAKPVDQKALEHALAEPSSQAEAHCLLLKGEAESIRRAIEESQENQDFSSAMALVRRLEALGPPFDQEAASARARTQQLAQVVLKERGAEQVSRLAWEEVNKTIHELADFDPTGRCCRQLRHRVNRARQQQTEVAVRQMEFELLATLDQQDPVSAASVATRLRALGGAGRSMALKFEPQIEALRWRDQARQCTNRPEEMCRLLRYAHRQMAEHNLELATDIAIELMEAERGRSRQREVDELVATSRWQRIVSGRGSVKDHRWLGKQLAGTEPNGVKTGWLGRWVVRLVTRHFNKGRPVK